MHNIDRFTQIFTARVMQNDVEIFSSSNLTYFVLLGEQSLYLLNNSCQLFQTYLCAKTETNMSLKNQMFGASHELSSRCEKLYSCHRISKYVPSTNNSMLVLTARTRIRLRLSAV